MTTKIILILEGTSAVGAVDVHLTIMLLELRMGIEYLYITSARAPRNQRGPMRNKLELTLKHCRQA